MLDPNGSNEKKRAGPWLFEGILIGDEILPVYVGIISKAMKKSDSVIFNNLRMSHGFRIIRVFFFTWLKCGSGIANIGFFDGSASTAANG